MKIQKTTSGKYFVIWEFGAREINYKEEGCFEEGKNCISTKEMPSFLAEHQECWESVMIEIVGKRN